MAKLPEVKWISHCCQSIQCEADSQLPSACFPYCLNAKFGGSVSNEFHTCYANSVILHKNKCCFSSPLSHQHRHVTPVDGEKKKMGFGSTQCSSLRAVRAGHVSIKWSGFFWGYYPLLDSACLPPPSPPPTLNEPIPRPDTITTFLKGFSISRLIKHFPSSWLTRGVNGDPFNHRNKQINL